MQPKTERLTLLFSATLTDKVRNLAWEYLNDPVEIELNPDQITVDTIKQELYHTGANEKMQLLLGILNKEKPKNCIIFTNTKAQAFEVAKRLDLKVDTVRKAIYSGRLHKKKV